MQAIRKLLLGLRSYPQTVPVSHPLMVVGMHRSGTSFLTGTLQQAGLELGKFSAWNPHNLKGNRENQDIVTFHDKVLSARGYAWDRPPAGTIVWNQSERQQAQRLIDDYKGAQHWGFKDPRSLLMVECWQQLIPSLRFIGIFRHPTAVVQSLQARGGMPYEQAIGLWLAYNSRLIELHQRLPFSLLCFDEEESSLHTKIDQLLPTLGLEQLGTKRFFSAELKHHQKQNTELPTDVQHLYQTLCQLAY